MLQLLDPSTDAVPEVRAGLSPTRWELTNSGLLISALRKSKAPLSIYVHIISRWQRVQDSYIDSVISETELLEVAFGRLVTQMHWGGTAAYLDTRQRTDLFNAITSRFPLAFGADVSLGLRGVAPGTRHDSVPEYAPRAGTDLIGFGVGAISHVGNTFVQNFEELEPYEDAIAADRLPVWRAFIRGRRV
jgi:coproporphyrinogen III oxidase-like Fe-S oxidoreductase